MKLSKWAKEQGISYQTAWRLFNAGHISGAYQLATRTIIVPSKVVDVKDDYVVVYARVSSSENRVNLESQAKRISEFCNAKGWIVKELVKECASGLNDKRPKLSKLLINSEVTHIVVEHKDRLTRFGFHYLTLLFPGKIVVINEVTEDEKDLMQDFVSLVTSFCARLYGKRRSKRKTERLIKELKND